MNLKSQSMRFIMKTMMDVEHEWQSSRWKDKSDMIDPDAPLIVLVS